MNLATYGWRLLGDGSSLSAGRFTVQLRRRVIASCVGFLLGGIVRMRDVVRLFLIAAVLFRRIRLSLNAGAAGLNGVRELVREQTIALLRTRCELAGTKMDVRTGRERASAKPFGRRGRLRSGVDANAGEVRSKLRFHALSRRCWKRRTRRCRNDGMASAITCRLPLDHAFVSSDTQAELVCLLLGAGCIDVGLLFFWPTLSLSIPLRHRKPPSVDYRRITRRVA